jgi:hypothetical protein
MRERIRPAGHIGVKRKALPATTPHDVLAVVQMNEPCTPVLLSSPTVGT